MSRISNLMLFGIRNLRMQTMQYFFEATPMFQRITCPLKFLNNVLIFEIVLFNSLRLNIRNFKAILSNALHNNKVNKVIRNNCY